MKRARFNVLGALALAASSLAIEFTIPDEPAPIVRHGAYAVVAVSGPMTRKNGFFWDSYESIQSRVGAALSAAPEGVLLVIDSPGGEAAGCFELSEWIKTTAAKAGKRVLAFVDGSAQSAAYALACSAERIFLPKTGSVGSIGCIKLAVDQTGMDRAMGLTFAVAASGDRKADGNPHVPISEEARASMQAEVDASAALFFDLVGAARGMSPGRVAGFEAASFMGADAVKAGLADEVTSFESLIAMLATGTPTAQQGAEAPVDEEKKKALAALKALAEAGDEKAKKALATMSDEDESKAEGDEEKPKDDEKKEDESKAEGDEEKPKDDEKKETEGAKALAATKALAAKFAAKEEQEERARLMASRPDFSTETVALLDRSPISVVRDAVKTLAKVEAPKQAAGPIASARSAMSVAATRGDREGSGDQLPPNEARDLDIRMGLRRETNAIRHEGNKLILGVMTPSEARAAHADFVARKGGAA